MFFLWQTLSIKGWLLYILLVGFIMGLLWLAFSKAKLRRQQWIKIFSLGFILANLVAILYNSIPNSVHEYQTPYHLKNKIIYHNGQYTVQVNKHTYTFDANKVHIVDSHKATNLIIIKTEEDNHNPLRTKEYTEHYKQKHSTLTIFEEK